MSRSFANKYQCGKKNVIIAVGEKNQQKQIQRLAAELN
jgi:uncharacterized protein YggU (UPF0235/DUF167 family)